MRDGDHARPADRGTDGAGHRPGRDASGHHLVRDSIPQAMMNLGVGIVSSTFSVGSGVGLVVAGAVLASHDFHLLFWMAAGQSAFALVLLLLVVSAGSSAPADAFPVRSTVLSSFGLLAVLLSLSQGGQWGWTSTRTVGCFLVGCGLFVVWGATGRLRSGVRHALAELRAPEVRTNLVAAAVGFAMLSNFLGTLGVLAAPATNGSGFGYSTLGASVGLVPGLFISFMAAPLAGRLATKRGATFPVLLGTAALAAGLLGRAVQLGSATWVIAGAAITYVGVGLAFSALPMLVMSFVPANRTATANSVNAVHRSVGVALAAAGVGALMSAFTVASDDPRPSLQAYRMIYLLGGVVALLAMAMIAGVRRSLAWTAEPGSPSAVADPRNGAAELVP